VFDIIQVAEYYNSAVISEKPYLYRPRPTREIIA
jgi:hypothetical protein